MSKDYLPDRKEILDHLLDPQKIKDHLAFVCISNAERLEYLELLKKKWTSKFIDTDGNYWSNTIWNTEDKKGFELEDAKFQKDTFAKWFDKQIENVNWNIEYFDKRIKQEKIKWLGSEKQLKALYDELIKDFIDCSDYNRFQFCFVDKDNKPFLEIPQNLSQIQWLNNESLFVYFIEKLKEYQFIFNRNKYVSFCIYFKGKDGIKYNHKQFAQTKTNYEMNKKNSGKPENSNIIDQIVSKIKNIP